MGPVVAVEAHECPDHRHGQPVGQRGEVERLTVDDPGEQTPDLIADRSAMPLHRTAVERALDR
ncbi:hypothetical protein ACRJ4W_12270 [Streptomyces sp. GLT-R25]